MALFEKKRRTSAEKARRAQMGMFARLVGGAYLIYLMIELIRTTLIEENPEYKWMRLGVGSAFLLGGIIIITATVIELVRDYKAGYYKASAYSSDFGLDDESIDAESADVPGIGDAGEDAEDNDYSPEDGKGYENGDEEDNLK